jgi:O-antigen ligase
MSDLNLARFDRIVALLAGLLVATWVTLSIISEGATRIFHWPWAFYAQTALLAPMVLLGWQWLRHTRPPAALLSVTAFAAFGTLLSVGFSRNPHFSLEVALFPLGGLAALLWFHGALARLLDDGQSEARVLRLAHVAGILALLPIIASALYFLNQYLPGGLAALANRNRHPFGHWNYTAGYLLLTLPWFLALAWHSRLLPRLLWLAATALSLAVLWTCHSRGAALGAMAGIALALFWRLRAHPPGRRQALVLVLGGLLACTALFLTNERLRGYVFTPETAFNPNEGDVQRLAMLEGGWLLFKDRPVLGHGPGLVPIAYPEVRGQLVGGVETSFQLHNSPLHLAATHGALGLVALLALAALIARGAWRWWRAPAGPARNFALTSLCAFTAYGAMSVTDYQLDVIAIVLLLAAHAALLLAAPSQAGTRVPDPGPGRAEKTEDDQRFDTVFACGLLALVVAAAIVLLPHWRARSLYWQASVQTAPEVRLRLLEDAANAAPWSAQYRNQHGFGLARLVEQHPDATILREAARESLLRSLLIERAQEPVHATLGWLCLPDKPAHARHHFEEAIRLLPDRPVNRLGLALAQLAQNDADAARQALAVECLVYPAFLLSPLWHAPGLMALRPEVLARVDELYADALAHPELPRWRVAPVAYSRALAAWIIQNQLPAPADLEAATSQQRAFFAALTAAPAGSWPAPWDSWQHLRDHPEQAAAILPALNPATPLDPVIIQAAETRLRLDSPSPDVLVRTLAPAGLPLVTTAFERGHYSLFHRSSDDAWYPDLGPRSMDALATLYLTPLLPEPAIIPAPVLLTLDAARTPSP